MRRVPPGHAVDVWWSATPAVTPGPAELSWLSAAERSRAASLAFAADRRRYLAAHVMLRGVLARYTATGPGALAFGREPCPRCGGPSGRPVLLTAGHDGDRPPCGAAVHPRATAVPFFSLAHSGDVAVVAVAGRPVGVDVERDRGVCVCALAGAAHPADAAVLAGSLPPERHAAVMGWWVRAEAVLKCGGEGIAHGLDAFAVLARGDPVNGCSATPLAAPPGHRAAVALAGAGGVAGESACLSWPG